MFSSTTPPNTGGKTNSSIMLYTQPSTEEQRRYYSKHSGKLGVYVTGRRVIQYLLWLPIASFALAHLLHQGLAHIAPVMTLNLWLCICAPAMFIAHRLLSQTFKTHFYDKWDDNPSTDSSLVTPLIIGALLVVLEYKALATYMTGAVERPVAMDFAPVDAAHNARIDRAKADYEEAKRTVREDFEAQKRLASPKDVAELERIAATKPATLAERDYLKSRAAELQRKIEGNPRAARITRAMADSLASMQEAHMGYLAAMTSRREKAVAGVDVLNAKKEAQYATDLMDARHYAGVISAICFLLFAILARAEVRIKTRSGIFPIRQFNDLRAHGDSAEKINLAFADIFDRWMHVAATAIHSAGSKGAGELRGFDGRIFMKNGNYQTDDRAPAPQTQPPHGQKDAPPPQLSRPSSGVPMQLAPLQQNVSDLPNSPSDHAMMDAAYMKVMAKIERHQREDPKFRVTPEQFMEEMKKAALMNGSYASAPFGGK